MLAAAVVAPLLAVFEQVQAGCALADRAAPGAAVLRLLQKSALVDMRTQV